MDSAARADREEVFATVTRWEHAHAEMAELSFTALTGPDVLGIQRRLESGYRSQSAVDHKLILQLTSQRTPTELGANSWPKVLSESLRISTGDAKRRIKQARLLGPRQALTGESLPPKLRDTERLALADAVQWHCKRRVLLNGDRRCPLTYANLRYPESRSESVRFPWPTGRSRSWISAGGWVASTAVNGSRILYVCRACRGTTHALPGSRRTIWPSLCSSARPEIT
jgi:hypothetical protein